MKLFTIILLMPLMALSQTPEERITKVLYDSGYSMRMTQIILAQARHESGNFTNPLTKSHCNVFGMRHPRVRPTTSLGPLAKAEGRTGYASFNSIEDATRDYILYSRYIKAPTDTTLEYYATFLHNKRYYECRFHSTGKGKCSRKSYSTALTNWMKLKPGMIVSRTFAYGVIKRRVLKVEEDGITTEIIRCDYSNENWEPIKLVVDWPIAGWVIDESHRVNEILSHYVE